ncbi:amidohydrolase 2, partial [Thozetella sp. PMI_491]
MDETGVDYMVLSLASPGIQSIANASVAEEVATRANDKFAEMVSNNTARFGAFAALSMHNASQAANELRRCVKELGFHGALLNDFQQAGPQNETLYYYDSPDYDVFWEAAVDLDVPVYLHPRSPISAIVKLDYSHAPWLLGAPQQFAVELSTHVAGLCTNGIFDRFPGLKVVVGHFGERLPSDFWRIDEMLSRKVLAGMPMKRNFSDYWRTNIYETTTGNFWTELLHFHTSILGADRILYSVDYPFVMMQQGAAWVASLPLTEQHKLDF